MSRRFEAPTEAAIANDARSVALFESALRLLHSRYEGDHVSESVKEAWRLACEAARADRHNRVGGDPKSVSAKTVAKPFSGSG